MCRFLAYKGTPILMHQLLYQPQNSLIHQSYHALERKDPVNGDGFGVGWYVQEIAPEPAKYVSVKPAWNDNNLQSIAAKTKSDCIFAHVRDASVGQVAELNCHPFVFKNLLMMHNGHIGQFKQIKRRLREILADFVYDWIAGGTDSEHFFALFLNELLRSRKTDYHPEEVAEALKRSIQTLKNIYIDCQVDGHFSLNLTVTNGKWIVATRYNTNKEVHAPTLYYSSKESRFECNDGVCQLIKAKPSKRNVLVVSEKLTSIEEDWHKIPEDHLVIVDENLKISILAVGV